MPLFALHAIRIDGGPGHGQCRHALGVQATAGVLHLLQIDQPSHQFGQAGGLLADTPGEIPYRIRIVGRVGNGFGQQCDRAGRRFQLVRDIGHELAAHLFEMSALAYIDGKQRI